MTVFAIVSEMGRGGVSVAVDFANLSATSLPGISLWPGAPMRPGVGFLVVHSLANRQVVTCAALNSFK